jgi:hypothetical protein
MIDGIEDLASRQWASALEGLTGEQIKSGLRACGTRKIQVGKEDWPPTPAEFRAMCIPEVIPKIHRDYISLPKPIQDKGMVDKSIAEIRKKLT